MMKIHEAREAAVRFLKQAVHNKPTVLAVHPDAGGFSIELEALEENPVVKSLGLPTVYDRHIYEIRLNEELEVVDYARKNGSGEEAYA